MPHEGGNKKVTKKMLDQIFFLANFFIFTKLLFYQNYLETMMWNNFFSHPRFSTNFFSPKLFWQDFVFQQHDLDQIFELNVCFHQVKFFSFFFWPKLPGTNDFLDNIFPYLSRISSSRQLKFQLNWDNIITTCLPTPSPPQPRPNRNSSRLAFTSFKDTKGLLWLLYNLEYEDDLKYKEEVIDRDPIILFFGFILP